jgi:hypothetical protein
MGWMNNTSSAGKRAAQTSFAVAGIVPVVAGLWGWTSNVKLEGIEVASAR